MRKLSVFLTLVLLSSFSTFVFADNVCEEVELGEYQKPNWRESLSDGLKGELVRQIDRRDDLFERLSPEIEYGVNQYIDLELQFNRSVKDNLPKLNSECMTRDDLFSTKVQNRLQLEINANVEGEFLFSEGVAGLHLVHSTNNYGIKS